MPDVFTTYGANTWIPSVMDVIPTNLHAAILADTSTVDVSSYVNTALANYKMVRLPLSGRIAIASPLVVPAGGGIFGENYCCTIFALPNFGNYPLVRNATMSPSSAGGRDKNLTFTGFRLDGNKANNTTATEFSHGIQLYAVDGCTLDVQVSNTKGDGICIMYSYGYMSVGSSYVSGKVRSSACGRQGVAIICGEQIDLDVHDSGGTLLSVDLEPDDPANFIRNILIRVLSTGTGNGTDVSGGVCIAGDGLGCIPTNVIVDFEIYNSGGYGVLWRDAQALTLRGSIYNPTHAGLIALDGGSGPSKVFFDGVRVTAPGTSGLVARETAGSTYDGSIFIEGSGSSGAQIHDATNGVLTLRIDYAAQQGLYLKNVHEMTFPNLRIHGCGQANLWLTDTSSDNRFPGPRLTGSVNSWGVLEASGCNNNRGFNCRLGGNQLGAASLSGAGSYFLLEP